MFKTPQLIDTHTHVNFKAFKEDGHEVIRRALSKGVWMINVGSQHSTSCRAVDYVGKYKRGVYAAVGLHPMHIAADGRVKKNEREFEEFDLNKYYELLSKPKVAAVGEIGLDYYHEDVTDRLKSKQKDILVQQIDLAQFSGKPIIFHCRKAYDDLLDVLINFNAGCAQCPHACTGSPRLRGVVHSFMGRWSQAQKFLDLGLYLGFNGLITYARDHDKVIRSMPLERILVETDAPYLTPEPHRGERNEPVYVEYVAKKLAAIRDVSYKTLAEQTTKNARELFGV